MVTNLKNLSEAVDRAATSRVLADEIDERLSTIKREIAANGYSEIEVEGRKFVIQSSNSQE